MSTSETPTPSPWYRDGLAFSCTRCGACCTGAPGYVWVSRDEIAVLAEHRGQMPDQFAREFVRRVGNRLSLIEKPGGDCVFWDRSTGCTVYESRPDQCRTWPFWPENIATPAAWNDVCRVCPGSGQGEIHTLQQIEASASRVRP
ncbi:MAG: YkgJ family cysteine cluster protein [Planctomycetota bacterium]|nr:YkgJ family cysteine cluster protein [Planctomycetota bacterium]